MILGFSKRDRSRQTIDALFARIAAAARAPVLYAGLGVPDTAEGRFEALTLHVVLVLRRLRSLPAPAADVAQDVVDTTFREFDRALRETGVGDAAVPKRMKGLAKAFYGRAGRYDEAFAASDANALAAALGRNVLGGEAPAGSLAAYVREAEAGLARRDLDGIVGAGTLFPDPSLFVKEEAR